MCTLLWLVGNGLPGNGGDKVWKCVLVERQEENYKLINHRIEACFSLHQPHSEICTPSENDFVWPLQKALQKGFFKKVTVRFVILVLYCRNVFVFLSDAIFF